MRNFENGVRRERKPIREVFVRTTIDDLGAKRMQIVQVLNWRTDILGVKSRRRGIGKHGIMLRVSHYIVG